MAHGVIPPFCGMLICEAFLAELCHMKAPQSDVTLLGSAQNAVVVPQEIVEAYFDLFKKTQHQFLTAGCPTLKSADGTFSRDAQLIVAVLLGTALGIDHAEECVRALAGPLMEGDAATWRVAANGPLRAKIQMVQEELGMLVKEGAKDVYTHAPEDFGYERLEQALLS